MKVNWKTSENQLPILFARVAEWTGFKVKHNRVAAGELLEFAPATHELSVTLAGSLTTRKHTATGLVQRKSARPGSICLMPANQLIAASWENELEYLAIELDPALFMQAALGNNFSPRIEFIKYFKDEDPLVQHIALALLAEANSAEPAGRLYAESLTQTLVLHLLRNYTDAGRTLEKFNGGLSGYKLRRVVEFIKQHLDEDLTLAEIARAAGLSQFHFARAFRRTTGQTPQQYLMQQRIERAKQLLANSDLPLIEVSARAGFKNQSHFTTLFRKFTHLTPNAWRKLKLV